MRFKALFVHYVYTIPTGFPVHTKHVFFVNVAEVRCDLSDTSVGSIQLKRKFRKRMNLEKITGEKEVL